MNAYDATKRGLVELNRRRDLCSETVTLNGEPAKIAGAAKPFATVMTLNPAGAAVQFSWATVDRILARDSAFTV